VPAFSLPPPPFRRVYPTRAFVLWALLRAGMFVIWVLFRAAMLSDGTITAGEPVREIIVLSGPATVGLVVLIGILGDIDARRRDEYVFLANLGIRRITVPLISGAVAAVAELLLRAFPW